MAEMTRAAIEKCIKEHDGYLQPYLNDQLYLHCKGFIRIEEVIGIYDKIKALWLQQNALSKIENLDKLTSIGCLYLHQNCITSMHGLSALQSLHTLNLSQNYITKIEGLSDLPNLETLLISQNRISDVSGLQGLLGCNNLSCLDIANNGLTCDKDQGETPEQVIDLLSKLPSLACLYIQGNELPNQTRYFRRKMVGTIKTLTFMDERPVFPDDRRATDAWVTGGFEAEQAERDAIREEKKQAEKASMKKYKAMQEAARATKEKREAELRVEEEKRQAWLTENKTAHQRERRDLVNTQEDEMTELAKEFKASVNELQEAMKQNRDEAERKQRSREEKVAAEEAALRDIEAEEKEREARRLAYLEELKQEKLTRDQELSFMAQEVELLEQLEKKALDSTISGFDTYLTPCHADPNALPAEKKNPAPTAKTVPVKRIRNPKTASIWEKYAAWENRSG
eukprot:TRINITY_DN4349_c8_g1_i1.p1 TRINITY_DN4349_c8_g1~~TRINITY_DN4349_c8_g1_i1.p1  ORF type:complete len:477 (+),score=161.71 TRINITY_DN4349_c8_g1_i1:70-1431(+)